MEFRLEKDTLGEVSVPADKYWGAQTERARNNFKIGRRLMPLEVIYALAIVKKAAAETNHELGVLEKEKAELIAQVCDEIVAREHDDQFPLSIWQTGSGTLTNMNVNEVVANRAHVLAGGVLGQGSRVLHPNDDVNQSQSSNDVFPTAMHVAGYQVLSSVTIPGVRRLREALHNQAEEFKTVVKTGRTHLMDATPITLGQEFSGFVSQLDHGLKSLENSLDHLSELALGGTAVGTGLNTPSGYDTLAVKKITTLTGLPFRVADNKFEAIASHDALVEAHGALKQLAVSLMKIANDIRLLASGPRCGIGEIIIPTNEPGSSIMPGKANPTRAEALTMVCAQVIGNDMAITVGGAGGHLELNAFKPMIIFNFLASARLLGDACVAFEKNCVVGIKPNLEKIKENLDNSLMLVTALNKKIGYDKAAEIAKAAYENGTTLKSEATKLGYVSESEFDELVDPRKMV